MNPAHAITLTSAAIAIASLALLTQSHSPVATALCLTGLGLAMLCDRFDGWVARRLGLTSPMGERLDSLADLLAFAAVPAALMVARFGPVALTVALPYALGGVWRLARYDGDELMPSRWGPCFSGLPTSAAASTVIVATALEPWLGAWISWLAMGAMAVGMPSRVRYPKGSIGAYPWFVLVPLALVAVWVQALR